MQARVKATQPAVGAAVQTQEKATQTQSTANATAQAQSTEQRARQAQNVTQPAEQQAPAPARRTRLVIALGGNMLQPHQGATASEQKRQVARVASLLVDLAADYEIVLNHGAGPQIGNLDWHENMGASDKAPAMPLETVIAMTQGQIGYWLMQALYFSFHLSKSKMVCMSRKYSPFRKKAAMRLPRWSNFSCILFKDDKAFRAF